MAVVWAASVSGCGQVNDYVDSLKTQVIGDPIEAAVTTWYEHIQAGRIEAMYGLTNQKMSKGEFLVGATEVFGNGAAAINACGGIDRFTFLGVDRDRETGIATAKFTVHTHKQHEARCNTSPHSLILEDVNGRWLVDVARSYTPPVDVARQADRALLDKLRQDIAADRARRVQVQGSDRPYPESSLR